MQELIERLQRMDALRAFDGDHYAFCSEAAKFAFDDLVVGSGAKLIVQAHFAGVIREGRRVQAILVEGKRGRHAIRANVFIDCTGDADLVRRTGCETDLGDGHGRCQPPTLCFRVAGRAPDAVSLFHSQDGFRKEPMDYNGETYSGFLWTSEGIWDKSETMVAGTRVTNVNGGETLDLSRAEIESRYQLRWLLGQIRKLPGWEKVRLVDVAAQLGTRESYRIVADHQVTRQEILEGNSFPDAIAQGTYRVDVHKPDGMGLTFMYLDGHTTEYQQTGHPTQRRWDGQPPGSPPRTTLCWQVPYRALIPRDLDNVLAAGRCIGADRDAAGALRVMVNCMQFGQAAGEAAAMARPTGSVRDVDMNALRARLIANGVPLRKT